MNFITTLFGKPVAPNPTPLDYRALDISMERLNESLDHYSDQLAYQQQAYRNALYTGQTSLWARDANNQAVAIEIAGSRRRLIALQRTEDEEQVTHLLLSGYAASATTDHTYILWGEAE